MPLITKSKKRIASPAQEPKSKTLELPTVCQLALLAKAISKNMLWFLCKTADIWTCLCSLCAISRQDPLGHQFCTEPPQNPTPAYFFANKKNMDSRMKDSEQQGHSKSLAVPHHKGSPGTLPRSKGTCSSWSYIHPLHPPATEKSHLKDSKSCFASI